MPDSEYDKTEIEETIAVKDPVEEVEEALKDTEGDSAEVLAREAQEKAQAEKERLEKEELQKDEVAKAENALKEALAKKAEEARIEAEKKAAEAKPKEVEIPQYELRQVMAALYPPILIAEAAIVFPGRGTEYDYTDSAISKALDAAERSARQIILHTMPKK